MMFLTAEQSQRDWDLLRDQTPRFMTRDPAEAQKYLSAVFRPHSLKSAGRRGTVDFRHIAADLGPNVSLHALSYGSEVFNEGGPSDDCYLVVFTLAGTLQMRASGREVVTQAGSLCIMNPRQPFSTHLSADHRQLTLRMAGALLREHLMKSLDTSLTRPLEFDGGSYVIRQQAHGLKCIVGALCEELRNYRSAFLQNPVVGHLEQVLAGLLLAEIPNSYTTGKHLQAIDVAPRYVRAAQEYIRTSARRKVSILDIAAAVNVTPRTLQSAFRRYADVTPHEYLRNARLDLATEELSRVASRRPRLSDIAFDCGFASASKFARYYRERFGHSPSATTRRRS
jgi:AraC-like DNA-binding protein